MALHYGVKDGSSYGIPYRTLLVKGIDNLHVSGMMITSDHKAHMSTRNTVSCLGQGQASGTAAALRALNDYNSTELPYAKLREMRWKKLVFILKVKLLHNRMNYRIVPKHFFSVRVK